MGWWGSGQETRALDSYPIISAHLHLFQRGFRQNHVIDPDGAFAVDDEVESDFFRSLPLLKQERRPDRFPVGFPFHRVIHPPGKILPAADVDPHFQIGGAVEFAFDAGLEDQPRILYIQTGDLAKAYGGIGPRN